MRRLFAICTFVFFVGCGPTVTSTTSLKSGEGGVPYALPMGLVPIIVFADAKGVGITIEPATKAVDSSVGTLVGRLRPNAFNNEKIKIEVDPVTGFLKTVSSDSEAQILAIAAEAAKASRQLVFQNSQAQFLNERVVVLKDSFDPLDQRDIARINRGITHAIRHASRAFDAGEEAEGRTIIEPLRLRVTMPDGSNPFRHSAGVSHRVTAAGSDNPCKVGICVRSLTARMIRVEIEGTTFGSKLVNVPERNMIPVGVPSTLFANQKIEIKIVDGILQENSLERESEALGLVKVPGAIIGGLVAGTTQALTDEKSILDKQKDLADSQKALIEANSARDTVSLQNATAGGKNDIYALTTLTIYPYSNALTNAIKARKAEAAAKTKVVPGSNCENQLIQSEECANAGAGEGG